MVAAGFDDGTVSVWSLGSAQLLAQRKLVSNIVYGIAFAGLTAGGRFARQQALLAVTAGEQIALLSAGSLRLLGSLPCDDPPSPFSENFKSVCADRDGRFIAAGRANGQVRIWQRGARQSYDLLHSISLPGNIIRVLFPVRDAGTGALGEMYIARAMTLAERPSYARGERCEISRWEFSARAEPSRKAAVPAEDITDIAAAGDGMVISSHRFEYGKRSITNYSRFVSGAVESHGVPPLNERVRYFTELDAGALSVAVTADLRTAFARCDNGQVAVVKPRS
jgi:hypothetical protein